MYIVSKYFARLNEITIKKAINQSGTKLRDSNVSVTSTASSPVTLPDLYFDSFSYPVAPIVSSAGGIA